MLKFTLVFVRLQKDCQRLAGSRKDCFPTALALATKGNIRKASISAGRQARRLAPGLMGAVLWN